MFHKFQTTCEQISLHKPQKMTNDHKFSMYVYEVIMFFFFLLFSLSCSPGLIYT